MYFCKELVISLIENVIEQNPIGFPNSMYPHVGPCTPYFGFGYGGIGSVPTMWPPIFNPLVNFITPLNQVLGIAQARIVTNCKDPSDENKDYFKRKHNTRTPQIVPIGKSYNEQRNKPSPIGDASGPPISGQIVPTSNSGGKPFGGGGNTPLGGNGGGPPRGGDNRLTGNQNPR
jgi:hypothetical protein